MGVSNLGGTPFVSAISSSLPAHWKTVIRELLLVSTASRSESRNFISSFVGTQPRLSKLNLFCVGYSRSRLKWSLGTWCCEPMSFTRHCANSVLPAGGCWKFCNSSDFGCGLEQSSTLTRTLIVDIDQPALTNLLVCVLAREDGNLASGAPFRDLEDQQLSIVPMEG